MIGTPRYLSTPPLASASASQGPSARMWVSLPLLIGLPLLTASCDFDMEGKHRCESRGDCLEGKRCIDNTCMKACKSPTDCAADERCSYLPDEDIHVCSAEDRCSREDACDVGDFGAVCSEALSPDRPFGCIKGGCADTSHCPESWQCLIDEFDSSALGACSDGELGHPCRDTFDCNDFLVCSPDNTCADFFSGMTP